MNARNYTAALGAVLVAGHLVLNAAGYASPRQAMEELLSPERLLRFAVSMELGGTLSEATAAPMPTVTVVTHTPAPTPTPAATPQVLDAIIAGGIAAGMGGGIILHL